MAPWLPILTEVQRDLGTYERPPKGCYTEILRGGLGCPVAVTLRSRITCLTGLRHMQLRGAPVTGGPRRNPHDLGLIKVSTQPK